MKMLMYKFTDAELRLYDALLTVSFDDEFIEGIMCICDFEADQKALAAFIDNNPSIRNDEILKKAIHLKSIF